MRQRNPFEVLGVTPQAERTVFRAAYRALAKMYHPDTRQGIPAEVATERMVELNWAWEELQSDLAGWRLRVAAGHVSVPGRDSPDPEPTYHPPQPEAEPFDEEAAWREFTDQFRRPKGEPWGWRAWIGSDVVCRDCRCTLNSYVYKCPDCGQTGKWERSKLYAIGHRLSPAGNTLLFAAGMALGLPIAAALLGVPPILVLAILGLDEEGGPWEWGITGQILFGIGFATELGLIAAWHLHAYSRRRSAASDNR